MGITFQAKTNKNYVMINAAIFKLREGGIIRVDRQLTEYSINDNELQMIWSDCYVCSINDVSILSQMPSECALDQSSLFELLDGAKLLSLEIEDDAEEDYKITKISWNVCR